MLRIALRALRRNKMRTVLTMLGMIIGVGAVIASVSITSGARQQVEEQIASLGENMLLIFPGSFSSSGARLGWGNWHSLKLEDALAIQTQLQGVAAVSPENSTRTQVIAGNQNWNTRILGESPQYLQIRQWPLAEGEMFGDQQVHTAAKVCVIGKTVAQQLFPNEEPLGKMIRIRSVPCQIIGLLQPKGLSPMGSDQDDVVIVPYTTELTRINREDWLDVVLVQAVSQAALPIVQQEITSLLYATPPRQARRREGLHRAQPGRHCPGRHRHRAGDGRFAGGHCRGVADRRRHRHHEHHAGQRDRTHARDRHPHGRGRARTATSCCSFSSKPLTLSLIGGAMGIASGMTISHFVAFPHAMADADAGAFGSASPRFPAQ